jgi:ABC-type nitrate/sulfonate/bicarbonate transport system permease component
MQTQVAEGEAQSGQAHGTLRSKFAAQGLSLLKSFAFPVGLVIVWQIIADLKWVNPVLMPSPERVVQAAWKMIISGDLFVHIRDSLIRIAWANTVSILTAVPLGFAIGLYRTAQHLFDVILNVLRPIPPLAWIPLAILWFGLGERAIVFITSIAAFFAILLNTIAGVRNVERSWIRAALTLGASRTTLFLRVILPATLPSIFTGLRIALGVSWMSIVAAELIAAASGLGFMITYYRELLRSDLIVVGMLTIGAVGYVMDRALIALEKKLMPWRTNLVLH